MGLVDLAIVREGSFERLVAVKRLLPRLAEDDGARRSFLEEARVAGLLRHANVVPVIDVGEDDDGPYLVMEYVDGVPLSSFLRLLGTSERRLPTVICLGIVRQIASALSAAHSLTHHRGQLVGLVHRDVTPSNILVGVDGIARLTDFGIARASHGRTDEATSEGIIKGKMGYMAPEVLEGRCHGSIQSDLFSLGVVLYETLTQTRLYSSKLGVAEVVRRILEEPPPDIGDLCNDAPPELTGLMFDLLAKKPSLRPRSAVEVVEVLESLEATFDPPPLGLPTFLEHLCGTERAALQQKITQAVTEHSAKPAPKVDPVSPPTKAPTKRSKYAVIGVVLAAVLVGVSWTVQQTMATPDIEEASAVEVVAEAAPLAIEATEPNAGVPESVPIEAVEVAETPPQTAPTTPPAAPQRRPRPEATPVGVPYMD